MAILRLSQGGQSFKPQRKEFRNSHMKKIRVVTFTPSKKNESLAIAGKNIFFFQ